MRTTCAVILTGMLLTGGAGLCGEAPAADVVRAEGDPLDGLRSRLVAQGRAFRAGHPVPMSFEVENVGKEPVKFGNHSITASMGLVVTDAEGKNVPFLAGRRA